MKNPDFKYKKGTFEYYFIMWAHGSMTIEKAKKGIASIFRVDPSRVSFNVLNKDIHISGLGYFDVR